ncbi:MAG TPA: hypothetical protein VGH61_12705, partial [Steroidobacteraceae bacterium]
NVTLYTIGGRFLGFNPTAPGRGSRLAIRWLKRKCQNTRRFPQRVFPAARPRESQGVEFD